MELQFTISENCVASRHYCVRGKSLIQFLHVNFVYKCEPVFFLLSISLATIIFSCVDILSSASCIKARPLFRSALCVAGSLIGRFYAAKKCRRDPVESYSVSGPLEGSERPTTAKAAQCWGKEIRYRDTNSQSFSRTMRTLERAGQHRPTHRVADMFRRQTILNFVTKDKTLSRHESRQNQEPVQSIDHAGGDM